MVIPMNYSYVMGTSNIEILKEKQFNIKKIGNSYGVTFDNEKIEDFENYIYENLNPGFWNEYLGKEKVFIFKHKNNEIEKFILNDENESEVLYLCNTFASCNFESIDTMLKENEFYKETYYKEYL